MNFSRLAALFALVACSRPPAAEAPRPLKVAAASDLAFAFAEMGELFERQTGTEVVFSFGSSGQLAKQLIEGAPFDVFAAANVSFVDDVVREGACLADTETLYARGRLVVWTDGGAGPVDSLAQLAEPRFSKLAIANPEHAPYGKAARQALERTGLWAAVQPRLVYGENIKQTLQYATSGNVEAAIVALSLAVAGDGGQYIVVDESLHEPLDQALVACNGGAPAARHFTELVASPEGRTIMRRFGFSLPGEATAQAP